MKTFKKVCAFFTIIGFILFLFSFTPLYSQDINEIPEETRENIKSELSHQNIDESKLELYYNHQFKKLAGSYSDPILSQFGYDLFRDTDAFQAITELTVGPDYVVGPGDVLKISVYGSHSFEEIVEVNRNGVVSIPEIGTVNVWGLEFSEVKEVLTNKIKSYYSGIEVSITMDELRSLSVYVVGEVKNPGIKVMSSLSTVIHGILKANGLSKRGSLRNIQVIRDNEIIAEMDLYDFLLEGKKKYDIRLNNGDTIFVPPIKNTVAIGGEIKNNAIYETKEEIRLSELIEMAGGLTSLASTKNILIERIENNQKKTLKEVTIETSLAEFAETEEDIYLEDGDLIYIGSITGNRVPERSDYITISGNIEYPGEYSYSSGITVKEIIEEAGGILPETIMGRAEIYRYVSQNTREIVDINLEKALEEDPDHNIELQEWDHIKIFADYDVLPEKTVEAVGELNEPDVYKLTPGKTVRDLIFEANELTEKAYLDRAEVFRKRDDELREVIQIDLNKVLDGEEDIELESGDILKVYSTDWVFPQKRVSIEGAVEEPGSFELYEGMKLSDLVFAAGGFKKNALKEKLEIYRPNYGWQEPSEIIQIDFSGFEIDNFKSEEKGDSNKSVSSPEMEEKDISLREGDRVFVRTHVEDMKERKVKISGEVEIPGNYPITRGETLSSVIDRAGGLTSMAYPFGAVFVRDNIKEKQRQELQDYISYQQRIIEEEKAELMELPLTTEEREKQKKALDHRAKALELMHSRMPEGRIIFDLEQALAEEENPHNIMLADQDKIHIPARPQVVIMVGEVYNPESIIFEPGRNLNYYLEKVGGITDTGDKKALYILRANGEINSDVDEGVEIKEGDMIIIPPEDDELKIPGGIN